MSFINVEDLNLTGYLYDCVSIIQEEYVDERVHISSCSEQYLTISFSSEDFGDVKDLCSFISSTLLELEVYSFSIIYQE